MSSKRGRGKPNPLPDSIPSYEDHIGMMVEVLGFKAAEEGEGVEPFLRACKNYDPEEGSFGNWLWNNLLLHRKDMSIYRLNPPEGHDFLFPIDPSQKDGSTDPAVILERFDLFKECIQKLSADAKLIVGLALDGYSKVNMTYVGHQPPTTGTPTQIRREIRIHCRERLGWSWPRYWRAYKQIIDMLEELR